VSYGVRISRMANLRGLSNIVTELRAERTNLVTQLRHVDAALAVLGKLNGGSAYTKPRRTLSGAGRQRIAAAQRARWAKRKSAAKSAPAKRRISAAGVARIRAAAKARWAKIRAQKKKK
jgi:hypothetical protein